MAVAWWYLVGKRVRARARLQAAASKAPFAYEIWIRSCESRAIGRSQPDADRGGTFAVFIHVPSGEGKAAAAALNSVLEQTYPATEIFLSGAIPQDLARPRDPRIARVEADNLESGLAQVIEQTDCDYVVPLRHDARLAQNGLRHFATAAASAHPALPLLYGDQDELDSEGKRQSPWFKPGWNREMFYAQDYMSQACAIPVRGARSRDTAASAGRDPLYSLLLDLIDSPEPEVLRIPAVVTHTAPNSWQERGDGRLAELQLRLGSRGCEVTAGPFGTTSIAWPLSHGSDQSPLVTIIVPTRDRLDLLRPCIQGVLGATTWPNFEVLVVDNGSTQPDTLAYLELILEDHRVRILRDGAPYNFAALNNRAADAAKGAYLCLLNNDTELANGEWLTELMRYALRPDSGAVGARLLYPDRSIQHAGVTVGLGGAAGHAHRGLPEREPGYFARAYVAHEVTAVTAACLVVRKDRYMAVGGLDAAGLAVAYNDIDLCLKLRAAGWRNYYSPRAILLHYESKSRGQDLAPAHRARYEAELAVFQHRWSTRNFDDPLHHPWLDRSTETYLLHLGEPWS